MTKYFDKIYSNGFHHLDHGKPALIVANHPSAFTEPCIMAMLTKRHLHFLVRGDYFLWWNTWLFRLVRLVPIFRMSETRDSSKKNRKTFDESNRYFHNNKVICIFAEGLSNKAKNMDPLQKGFARMAWSAYQDGIKDLQIHVLGTHFSNIQHPGGRAVLNCSAPIPFQNFVSHFEESESVGYRKLLQDISDALQSVMVTIDDMDQSEARDKALNRLHLKFRSKSFKKWNKESEYAVIELSESKEDDFDRHDDVRRPKKKVGFWQIVTIPLLLIIAPFYFIVDRLSKAMPMKAEFLSSFRVAFGILIWPIYVLLFTILFFSFKDQPWTYLITWVVLAICFQIVSNLWTSHPEAPFHPEEY